MTSAELLAQFKLLAQRPSTDELLSDAQIYGLLTLGQQRVQAEIAIHVPEEAYSAPVKMTTSDNIVYTVPSSGTVLGGFEVYASSTDTEPLRAGAYWDDTADYTVEGDTTIRMIGNTARTFADGPYIRYVPQTSTIDGSTQPTLKPAAAHPAIVYDALLDYAALPGVISNADGWRVRKRELLWGDGQSLGIIPALKARIRPAGRFRRDQWWGKFLG